MLHLVEAEEVPEAPKVMQPTTQPHHGGRHTQAFAVPHSSPTRSADDRLVTAKARHSDVAGLWLQLNRSGTSRQRRVQGCHALRIHAPSAATENVCEPGITWVKR
jgi:hypothetical protein